MTIWLDNHLSPALARWMAVQFGEPCVAIRDLGYARTADHAIFAAAKGTATTFITKDRDFAELVSRLGPPPSIVLLSCGNTSTAYLRERLGGQIGEALKLTRAGEPLVEIGRTG